MNIEKENLIDYVKEVRRHLHRYPEIGFNEKNTSSYIAGLLNDLGLDVIENVAGTGVIGILKGKNSKGSVAVRADMDCLSVQEETGLDFSSAYPGLMHACGHDGHMAAALGLAKVLSGSKKLNNNVVFIFQPAEEGPGGAKPIIDSGILNKLCIKAILGMHIFPEIEEGRIGCCSGPITARNGEIDINIIGKAGHGALPHTAIDSIVCTSALLQSIQTIITRKIDPRENAVITFGKINGGQARNIIAESVLIQGTIRTFNRGVYKDIKDSIYKICNGIGSAYGCDINVEIRDMYPEVYNDDMLYNSLIKAVGKENIDEIKPLMIAEDFSYYKEIAPELMFLLGSRNESLGYIHPLHSSKFNFREDILIKSIDVLMNMIKLIDIEL